MAASVEKNQGSENKQSFNLGALEDKVVRLINLVKQLKEENALLAIENEELKQSLDALEKTVAVEAKSFDNLSQEKAMTKVIVDDLINSIDSLVAEPK